ncbi:MAG: type I-C CRISPR-associated protein Cas8c/Csd1 [Actinomycetota bacterium]
MLLKALRDQAAKEKELPDFHSSQEVRYAIDIDERGVPTTGEVRELQDPGKPSRGPRLTIPSSARTSGIAPLPLDRADYVLGIPPPTKSEEAADKARIRTGSVHAAYVSLLEQAAVATGSDRLAASHRFARDVEPHALKLPMGFDASRFTAIYVNGKCLAEDPVVRDWWIARSGGQGAGGVVDRTCGVCGSRCSPVENMPVQIRGLARIGGQATMALVSGNAEVFERHGMTRATGASICQECGNSTHQMLNQLIASQSNSFSYGSGLFVWWSAEEVDQLIGSFLSSSDLDVRDALASLLSGGRPVLDLDSPFVAVTLGANASRVVVRAWLDMSIREALLNIDRWFNRINVVERDGSQGRSPSVFALLASIAPPGQGSPLSKLRPDMVDALIRAALSGHSLPLMFLTQTLGRLRATGGEVRPPIAALLKACITPVNCLNPEVYMASLDEATTDEAYLCGRLLALLDNAARLATSANNSLLDRSYAATSTMPRITLTRLLRLHRAHLEKLKRDKPGAASRIDRAVISIMAQLSNIPKTLPVDGQARFALGLYHQQAADRAAIQAAKEAKILGEIAIDEDNQEGDQN